MSWPGFCFALVATLSLTTVAHAGNSGKYSGCKKHCHEPEAEMKKCLPMPEYVPKTVTIPHEKYCIPKLDCRFTPPACVWKPPPKKCPPKKCPQPFCRYPAPPKAKHEKPERPPYCPPKCIDGHDG